MLKTLIGSSDSDDYRAVARALRTLPRKAKRIFTALLVKRMNE